MCALDAQMSKADPEAIWLMQGWLFQSSWWKEPQITAYLGGVGKANTPDGAGG